jgi:hypothetical protein
MAVLATLSVGLVSALSSLGAASPATLYVAPEGADGPNCGLTRETACASFDRAYHAAAPGDEVEIAGGNYPPQLFSPDPTKTSEDDVVFRPAPGARVELRCANFANCLATEGADHLTVSGIETAMIADLGGKPRQAGVAVDTGSADVTFEDIDAGLLFIDSDATRVNILGGDYGPVVDTNSKIQNGVGPDILIDGARFHDHVKVTENQHVECLALYGADGVTIRNSRFDTCQDFGIFGSPDAGEHYRDVTLENNFFSNSGKVSMSAHFKIGSHGGDCSNFLVRNNTFYDENVIAECGIEGGTATNMRWIGNLIADPGDDQRAGDPCSPGPHVFDHNVIEVGPTCGPNDRVVDNAGFVDIYTGNLHLLPTSPAIDAGSVAESPATDIDGEQREPGAPDAGADEYTGERDPVTASIGDVTVRENVAGGKAVFDVTLSRQAPRQIEIDWEAKPGTAGLGDFTAGTGTLVIPPAGRSGTIEVPIVNDSLTEPLEKFTVELSNPRGAALADGVGEGSIDDDDGTVPQIDIADAEAAEGSGVQFKVSLTSPLARSVTVKFTTSPGTARQEPAPGQPQDYLGQTNATLVIPANTIQITRTVNTASDDLVEPDETFTARLSAPTEAVIGDGTATGTIRDEDRAITVGDAQVTEGADVAFPITLSEPAAAGGVKLRLRTTDGSAKSGQGQDFTARDEVITIPAGQSQATFAVATLADALDESFETFSLLASAPQGAKIADGSATGTIVDDDDPPALTVGAAQAAEGEALTFPVALSAPSGREVRATLSTRDGSAQAPGDYAARTEEIVIAAGATGASFTVPGAADGVDEQDETFDAVIGAPVNATVADPDATGTIVDDDTAALSVGDAQVGEGGTLSFPVTLSTPSSRAVSALLQTSNGSATSPGDYAPRSDTVILPAGETQVAFTVETATDQLDEPDETLAASASNVTDAAAGTLSGTGTIADDDDPPAVSVGAAQAGEGGVLSFPVTLSAPSGRTVKAVLSTRDGSASAPGDYTARADVAIELGPGETAAAFTVQSAQDQVDEDDEQLTATIVGREHAQAGVLSAGGTIGDDDTTSVGFAADPSVEEGATAVATVRLSMPSTRPVRVEVSTEDGTATQPADYTRVQGHEVTIAAGSTEATVSVPTATDTTDEPDETFRLGLSAAQGAQLGDDSATVTIRDDDPRKVSVGDATASEGERLTFPVRLTTASDEPVTLTLTTADDTAHASDDYTARSGQVTLPAGATEASFTVDTAEDTIDEPDETLHVVISNVQGDAVPATATPANGTIADDDARPHASIEAAEATEGAKLRFRVRLSHPSSRPVGLSLSTADGTAAAPGDYAARTGATLDVAPGQTEAFFEFDTVADESVEGDETLTARIESATNADVGAAAQAVGTIRDDDRSLTVAAAEATEGDGVEFDVSLSGPAVKTVNLRLRTVAGPAVAGQDFITTDEQLTIAAGQSGTTFTVPTLEDQLDEDAEGFTVQLSELQGASLDGDGEAAGTILDDDDPPAVSLGAAQAGEGDELGFPVSLSAPSGRPVSVRLSTSDDGATAGSDYTPRSDVDVVFAPGDTAKAFTVASIED